VCGEQRRGVAIRDAVWRCGTRCGGEGRGVAASDGGGKERWGRGGTRCCEEEQGMVAEREWGVEMVRLAVVYNQLK